MSELGDIVLKGRSKNAGPFWLIIDIFCGSEDAFSQVTRSVSTARVASLLDVPQASIKRFEIADLMVVKLSLPRPETQGAINDRDMHGAAIASLIREMPVN